jgi:hypothetical protein
LRLCVRCEQVHTLTYEFTGSLFVELVTIYNKPGYTERLAAFTISVGDSLTSLSVCASGGAVAGVDVYPTACGATGRFMPAQCG